MGKSSLPHTASQLYSVRQASSCHLRHTTPNRKSQTHMVRGHQEIPDTSTTPVTLSLECMWHFRTCYQGDQKRLLCCIKGYFGQVGWTSNYIAYFLKCQERFLPRDLLMRLPLPLKGSTPSWTAQADRSFLKAEHKELQQQPGVSKHQHSRGGEARGRRIFHCTHHGQS